MLVAVLADQRNVRPGEVGIGRELVVEQVYRVRLIGDEIEVQGPLEANVTLRSTDLIRELDEPGAGVADTHPTRKELPRRRVLQADRDEDVAVRRQGEGVDRRRQG